MTATTGPHQPSLLVTVAKSHAVAYFFASCAALSALVTMFVDPNLQISIKWIFAFGVVSATVILTLAKAAKAQPATKEIVIPFDEKPLEVFDGDLLLVRRTPYFVNPILVAGYRMKGELERLAFIGNVEHIQEKFVQIRVELCYEGFDPIEHFKEVVVRPVVPRQFVELLIESQVADQQNEPYVDQQQEVQMHGGTE